jgi:two-component system, sensor histidine kinase and response regulator
MQIPTPGAARPDRAEEILDRETALARVDGDAEIMASLVEIYFTEIDSMMDAVRGAVKTGDPRGVEKAAHRLKGSVSIFGAGAATKTAFELEKAGRSGDLEDGLGTLAVLEEQILRLKPALENFRSDLQSPSQS